MKKKGLEFLAKIFRIMTYQVNGNYCAESNNNEFPADQLEPNAKSALFLRKTSHTHYFRQVTTILLQSRLMGSGEYNFFFKLGKAMRHMPTFLRQ